MALSGVHRSSLKQTNKKHNILGHKTKGQLKALYKGRVTSDDDGAIIRNSKRELSRQQRKNQTKQIRAHKKEEALNKKRRIGAAFAPPFLVAIIPLSSKINPRSLINSLCECEETSLTTVSPQGIVHLSSTRFKQRFSFVVPPLNDLYAILDTVKVCSTVIFMWQAGEDLGEAEKLLLSSITAQGMPSNLHTVIGLNELSSKTFEADELNEALASSLSLRDQPHRMEHKKNLALKNTQRQVSTWFPEHLKLHATERLQDTLLLLRQIGAQKQKNISYRDQRSNMIAEKVVFEGDGCTGTLKVYGYVRSGSMSSNRLVHIPGMGEFQLDRIEAIDDPHPLERSKRSPLVELTESPRLLEVPNPTKQETLTTTIEEFVVEEELPPNATNGPSDFKSPLPVKKRAPRGCSSYQAAWFLESDGEDEDGSEGDDCDDAMVISAREPADGSEYGGGEEEDDADANADADTMTDVDDDDYDTGFDYDTEMDILEKTKAARNDIMFPDEVDTPLNVTARERFERFRGLQSFRTSPWVESEGTPIDYQRIYNFRSYKWFKKRTLEKTLEEDGALEGLYVCVHLKDVPRHSYKDQMNSQSPFVLFSLHCAEQKMSLLHMVLKSNPLGHYMPIRSKERLIFHVGCRRFANCPIFNEHSIGDKHKFFRFFHPGDIVVASMFAPITCSPCPVSVFRERPDGSQDLVATGSVLSADASRVICKRVVLSGHPFKVNRKSAVVRYMFFNKEDVLHFKPIELRTKWGKRGHIKESLGTHGHMKCQFNGQLKSQDTVLMNLYKRVHPKWSYDPYVSRPTPLRGYVPVRQDEEAEKEEEHEEHASKKRKKVHFLCS